jgi:hypothetical protein
MNPHALQINDVIRVMFPACNKQDRIADNQAAIRDRCNLNRCRIAKVLDVTPAEFDQIANNYLEDRPDLFERIGGTELPPAAEAEFNALALANGIDPESDYAPFQPALREFYMEHCQVPVVLLRAPGRPLQYINTEGYEYARYVGEAFAAAAVPNCCCCDAPATNRVNDEKLGVRFACENHYGEVRARADYHYSQAHNQVERIEGDLYEPGLDAVVLARKLKALLRKLAPAAKWSVKAVRYRGVEAKLLQLPPGQAPMPQAGEDDWGFIAQEEGINARWGHRGYSEALGRLLHDAAAAADRLNCQTVNSHLQDNDWIAYQIEVGAHWDLFHAAAPAALEVA